MNYSENAINVFKKLYFKKDKNDNYIEKTPEEVFKRVSKYVANGDNKQEKEFYRLMKDGYFRPNTPCLINAGIQDKPQTAACFVGGMEDDLLSILNLDRDAAVIFASGSGIGANFGVLREKGAPLSSGGASSGPIAFLKKFAATGEAVKSGGRSRRAAILIMFFDHHPDLLDFITLKNGKDQDTLRSMNISVAISDAFMKAVENDETWNLVGVVDGKVKSSHKAKDIFNMIANNAYKTGDPGVWFIDIVNRFNGIIDEFDRIISTNPCVVGDTLVAVADGRDYVSIKQLAEEGNDILVHSVDLKTRRPSIKLGRNPRKTRNNVPILKITFDDGSFIRTTEDHKFLDYNGNPIKAKDLKPKQKLLSFIKFQNPNTTTGKMYWNIINRDGNRGQIPEHQLVLNYSNSDIKTNNGYVPHHKNGNSLDNTPTNLEWITIADHNKIEPAIYSGGNQINPMQDKKHSKKTKELIGEKTKKRFTDPTYRKNMSDKIKEWYTNNESKSKGVELVKRIEVECAYCNKILYFTEKHYKNKLKKNKTRNVFCSHVCSSNWVSENIPKKEQYSEDDILNFGIRYFNEKGKLPTGNGWDKWTKGKTNICSREVIRQRIGGFIPFKKMILENTEYPNHKVVSVRKDGFEDVYNITIDDNHTVAYITNTKGKTNKKGYPKLWGVYTMNCGEQPILNNACCSLSSINLAKFVKIDGNGDYYFDWDEYKEVVKQGTIFLDKMIEISGYPDEKYEKMAKTIRPLGLGIMGLADTLCLLDIPYNSQEAFEFGERIAKTLTKKAIETSIKLGEKYGSFPAFENNREGMTKLCKNFGVDLKPNDKLRNSNWTTIAPTGTTAISADCSPSMEPLFGITYKKNVSDTNEQWLFVNSIFEKKYKNENWYEEAIEKITSNSGSCYKIDCVPEEIQQVWKVAHDIHWKDRIEMQASLQKGISSAISSTVNLSKSATVDEIKEIYMLAWKKGLKGVTVYRDGCLDNQPVQFNSNDKKVEVGPKKRKKPKIREGKTYTIETGHGSIHITVNQDEHGNFVDLFNNGGKGGSVNTAQLEAIGRLISLCMQADVSINDVAKQLAGISDNTIAWDKLHPNDKKSVPILSIPDAIGKLLYKFYTNSDNLIENKNSLATLQNENIESEDDHCSLVCPDCGNEARMEGGCLTCSFCGSKCG